MKILKGRIQSPRMLFIPITAALLLLFSLQNASALTDTNISDYVEDELNKDIAIPAYRIDVATHDGIVTLEGSVTNLMTKKRATDVTETVKGVRAVVNAINVIPPMIRNDSEIKEDVAKALQIDPATHSLNLVVDVRKGVVSLSGTADSWQQKELCEGVAEGILGVTNINNLIHVNDDTSRSDNDIEAEIESALNWDNRVDDALINVKVTDGRVTLDGVVGSLAEKSRAIKIAHTAGVKAVSADNLKVRMWKRDPDLRGNKYGPKTDVQIQTAVKGALRYDPRLISFKVTPEVANGVVTLRGIVDNLRAKRAAEIDSLNTVGVVSVRNRVKIRPVKTDTNSDAIIKKQVTAAILRDSYVGLYKISADVHEGVVKLAGNVKTYFEKARAGDLAASILGVVFVENDIYVSNLYEVYFKNPYVDERWTADRSWYTNQVTPLTTSDSAIKMNILRELAKSPYFYPDRIDVSVQDGVATLTGNVESWYEYYAVRDIAYKGGALKVRNNLEVKQSM